MYISVTMAITMEWAAYNSGHCMTVVKVKAKARPIAIELQDEAVAGHLRLITPRAVHVGFFFLAPGGRLAEL